MDKTRQKGTNYPIPEDIFSILACPLCRADLEYTRDLKALVCSKCRAKYPIMDGIPILLPASRKFR
ncbi:MAG: Trm112 family protein [Nanoarchaeota archaeon]